MTSLSCVRVLCQGIDLRSRSILQRRRIQSRASLDTEVRAELGGKNRLLSYSRELVRKRCYGSAFSLILTWLCVRS